MNKKITSFTIGAAVGGIVALLTAPRSGEETRRKVQAGASQLGHMTKDRITDTAESLRGGAVATKDMVKDGVENTVHAVKKNASAVGDGATEGYRVFKEQVAKDDAPEQQLAGSNTGSNTKPNTSGAATANRKPGA